MIDPNCRYAIGLFQNFFSFWLPGGFRGTDPWVCCCMYVCMWVEYCYLARSIFFSLFLGELYHKKKVFYGKGRLITKTALGHVIFFPI